MLKIHLILMRLHLQMRGVCLIFFILFLNDIDIGQTIPASEAPASNDQSTGINPVIPSENEATRMSSKGSVVTKSFFLIRHTGASSGPAPQAQSMTDGKDEQTPNPTASTNSEPAKRSNPPIESNEEPLQKASK